MRRKEDRRTLTTEEYAKKILKELAEQDYSADDALDVLKRVEVLVRNVRANLYREAGKTTLKDAIGKSEIECLNNFNDETVLHYCTKQEMEKLFCRYGSLDWKVGNECNIKKLTADMVGFGTEQSQRIIIDYDKNYGKFLVRRIYKDYGVSSDTP